MNEQTKQIIRNALGWYRIEIRRLLWLSRQSDMPPVASANCIRRARETALNCRKFMRGEVIP